MRRPPPALANREVVARTAPPTAPGVRVRMVAPPAQQMDRERGGFDGRGLGRAAAGQPSRLVRHAGKCGRLRNTGVSRSRDLRDSYGLLFRQAIARARSAVQQQSRAPAVIPTPPAPGDTRSWAEREHALERSSLPSVPAQPPAPGRA